jgi:hypothetical protein
MLSQDGLLFTPKWKLGGTSISSNYLHPPAPDLDRREAHTGEKSLFKLKGLPFD